MVDVNVAGGTLSGTSISLLAVSYAAPFAKASGIAVAGGISVGLTEAKAVASGATRARMGGSVQGTTAGSVGAGL